MSVQKDHSPFAKTMTIDYYLLAYIFTYKETMYLACLRTNTINHLHIYLIRFALIYSMQYV